MYFKPTLMDGEILDPNTGETTPATAVLAGITSYTEQIIGCATCRVGFFDADQNYLFGDRWVTTTIPGTLLAAYRKVLAGTATTGSVDYFREMIMNSPEGNAAIPSV